MTSEADLLMRVRRRFGDAPRFALVSGATNAATNPVTLTLQAGMGGLFPAPGAEVEWGDTSYETGTVIELPDTDQVKVARSNFGEALATHADGARLYLKPRFGGAVLADLITDIVNELWPSIWVPKETTLAWQGSAEYYSPTPDDIEELSYAYQLSAGSKWTVQAGWLPPSLADDVNFPRGAITVPFNSTFDTTTIYVAYKAVPVITNLLDRQTALVVDGVIAKITMDEEARHVAPGASSVERRIADGAKLRAGAMLWEQFQMSLQRERVRLLTEERQGVRLLRG